MMKAVHTKALIAFVLVICLILLIACHKETELDKIRKVITSVQKAVEEKDIKTIITRLSKTYHDPQGFDYNSIKDLILGYFYLHQTVHVYIPDIDITVEGAHAKADFQSVLTGGQTGSAADILPASLVVYNFTVLFSKEERDWIVTSAVWRRVGDGN